AIALERRAVEEVAEAALEGLVPVVADPQHAVLGAERAQGIVAELAPRDLDHPAREVAAVEERDPGLGRGCFRGWGSAAGAGEQGGEEEGPAALNAAHPRPRPARAWCAPSCPRAGPP